MPNHRLSNDAYLKMLGATKYNRPLVLCANDSVTFLRLYKFMKMELENYPGEVERR